MMVKSLRTDSFFLQFRRSLKFRNRAELPRKLNFMFLVRKVPKQLQIINFNLVASTIFYSAINENDLYQTKNCKQVIFL
jgi:hypothetical protein